MAREKKQLLEKVINVILNILIFIFGVFLLISIYNNIQVNILGNDYSSFFGYSMFEVQTGSMSKAIEAGDMIVVKKENDIEINGVPINNNCVCKLPPDSTATLKTKDNKYSIGKSSLGNNLVIREKLDNDEYHKVIISPQNNVSEILYDDEWVDIKKDSESAKRINTQLTKILQIFL